MTKAFRFSHRATVAAVLGCLALTAPAAPAFAKKKEKEAETPKAAAIAASKGFLPAAKKMQEALKAKDSAALQAALTEGEASASTPQDKYLLADFGLQHALLTGDKAAQVRNVDAMIDSGIAPADRLGGFLAFSGQNAYATKDYAKAIKRIDAARAAGKSDAALEAMLMDSYLQSGQVDAGLAIAKAAIAANRANGVRTNEEMYVRPAKALQAAGRRDELLDLLAQRLYDYPTPATWRNTLYIHLQGAGEDKDLQLDVLRLMRATDSMTERAEYLEYAALATESGLPGEVLAVIKTGRDKKVIPEKDPKFDPIVQTQSERSTSEANGLTADMKRPATLASAKLAASTGDALMGYGRHADAITMYRAALAAPGANADMINYRLGVAQAISGDQAGAAASFEKVTGPRKRLAELWKVHFEVKARAAAAAAAPATPAS